MWSKFELARWTCLEPHIGIACQCRGCVVYPVNIITGDFHFICDHGNGHGYACHTLAMIHLSGHRWLHACCRMLLPRFSNIIHHKLFHSHYKLLWQSVHLAGFWFSLDIDICTATCQQSWCRLKNDLTATATSKVCAAVDMIGWFHSAALALWYRQLLVKHTEWACAIPSCVGTQPQNCLRKTCWALSHLHELLHSCSPAGFLL